MYVLVANRDPKEGAYLKALLEDRGIASRIHRPVDTVIDYSSLITRLTDPHRHEIDLVLIEPKVLGAYRVQNAKKLKDVCLIEPFVVLYADMHLLLRERLVRDSQVDGYAVKGDDEGLVELLWGFKGREMRVNL